MQQWLLCKIDKERLRRKELKDSTLDLEISETNQSDISVLYRGKFIEPFGKDDQLNSIYE